MSLRGDEEDQGVAGPGGETIKLTIRLDLSRLENPIHRGMNLVAEMRKAGIPAIGELWPEGVESGTLEIDAVDLDTGETEIRWKSS